WCCGLQSCSVRESPQRKSVVEHVVKGANQVLCTVLGGLKAASRRHRGRLDRKTRLATLRKVAEVHRSNVARSTCFKGSQRDCINLRAAESTLGSIKGICADVEAIGVGADQRLITETRTRAEGCITIVAHVEREDVHHG